MALASQLTVVQWNPGNGAASVTASGNRTSDTFALSNEAIQITIQTLASNTGTPAAGHTFAFHLQGTNEDQYATGEQGIHLYTLDTNDNNPAIGTPVNVPVPQQGGRIYVLSNGGAASVGASILQQRSE